MTDRVAMKRGLDQVYAYARGSARAFLDDHYRANNPFEIAKTYTVLPAVTSLLQLSERSWQVRWSEEHRGLDGTLLGKSTGEAVLAVGTVQHTAAGALEANHLGLCVSDIRWNERS